MEEKRIEKVFLNFAESAAWEKVVSASAKEIKVCSTVQKNQDSSA
jgi:hypothetical protein